MNAVQMALIYPQLQERLGVTPLKDHILTTVAIGLRDLPLKVVAATVPHTPRGTHTSGSNPEKALLLLTPFP